MSGDWIVDEMAEEVQRRLRAGFSGVLTVTMRVGDGKVIEAGIKEDKDEAGLSKQDG